MQFFDAATVAGTRRTRDGFLVGRARIARSGNIQLYGGQELGRPQMPVVRVWRPEEAVFDASAMASFAFKTVTNLHPSENVTSDTWKQVAVGMTGGEPARDGEFLTIPMMLLDGDAIQDFEDGRQELSCGYSADLSWEAGTTPDGDPYDAKLVRLVGNHVSLVPKGRAGSQCRLGDGAPPQLPFDPATVARALVECRLDDGGSPPAVASAAPPLSNSPGGRTMADSESIRTVVLDGHSIPVTPTGQEALTRLLADRDAARQRDVAAVEQRLRDAEAAARTEAEGLRGQIAALTQGHTQALADRDGQIAALNAAHAAAIADREGQIAALQSQVSDEALEARATARAALVADARRILGDAYNPAGKSDADVRKDVAVKYLGAALVDADQQPAAFFDGVFRTALATKAPAARPDGIATALAAGAGTTQPVADGAAKTPYQRHVEHLRNAWQTAGADPAGR